MAGYTLTPTAPRDVADVKPNVGKIYRARMYTRDRTIDIDTPLPETFPLDLDTTWDTPFNQPVSDIAGNLTGNQKFKSMESAASAAFGLTTINKWFSGAVWTQGSSITMQIPFVFVAYSDPIEEVLRPMREIMKLVAPNENDAGFLQAPGPHLLDKEVGTMGGEYIIVEIGDFLRLEPVIITGVHEEFDTQFDDKGSPISVKINVEIKSFWTITRQDLNKMFITVP